ELELQTCFAMSLLYTKGNVPEARSAIVRALEVAEGVKGGAAQLMLLHLLYRWHIRNGDFRNLPDITTRFQAVAKEMQDPLADAVGHALAAIAYAYLGDHRQVPVHARLALAHRPHSQQLNAATFGHLNRMAARVLMARSLWLLGYPDQALTTAGESLAEVA